MSTASLSSTDETAPTTEMNIRVYNTLSGKKEAFSTVTPGQVGMYLCGPTVYKEAHIGHMVGPVIFDCVKRYLTYCGFQVNWVVNITDVDDKLIAESNRRNIPMAQVAEEMTADYLKNLASLGVDQIDQMPRATDHITHIIEFIGHLIEKGFAYASEGDVYFEVARDREYGKLSNRTAEDQQGEGGDTASRKRAAGDFALWKKSKPGEPSWESPWGDGRPGWHIECSAMSRALLGETFDIHGGGLDLVFPHHENEIAQSECCHGQPMARYWMHNGLMRAGDAAGKVGGRSERDQQATIDTKISRSKGAGGLAELIERQTGERIRFFLLRTHYRSTILFSEEGLQEAGTAMASFQRFFERFERISGTSFFALPPAVGRNQNPEATPGDGLMEEVVQRRNLFLAKMDDDFNTGAAISELFELLRALNKFADANQLEDTSTRTDENLAAFSKGVGVLRELTSVLGIFLAAPTPADQEDDGIVDQLMNLLISIRSSARENKDFATADRVRDELAEMGIVLEDRQGQTTWRRDS